MKWERVREKSRKETLPHWMREREMRFIRTYLRKAYYFHLHILDPISTYQMWQTIYSKSHRQSSSRYPCASYEIQIPFTALTEIFNSIRRRQCQTGTLALMLCVFFFYFTIVNWKKRVTEKKKRKRREKEQKKNISLDELFYLICVLMHLILLLSTLLLR